MNEILDIPPLRGGQGRDVVAVRESATMVAFYCALAFILLAILAIFRQ